MGRLVDALEAEPEIVNGSQCTVRRILEGLPPADAADLRQLVESDVQATRLARALDKAGVSLSSYTIRRHRNGDCRCR